MLSFRPAVPVEPRTDLEPSTLAPPTHSPLDRLLAALIGVAMILSCLAAFAAPDFDRLQKALVERFGTASLPRFQAWRKLLAENREQPEAEKLRRVNDFFNRNINFDDDWSVWGAQDYWATPMETLGQGAGDCEDFVIAKYYSLLSLGVPVAKLRLVYVKARLSGPGGTFQQGHMVLAYYTSPDAEPLVLDNLNRTILAASKRPDLLPVFSFNSNGLWQGTGRQASGSSLSRWQDLQSRARAEGFQ